MPRLPTPLFASEEERFRALYERYHRLVRTVLFNLVGAPALEDLTQDVYLKAWQALPRFAGRASLKTWLYRITVNVAVDHLRRRRLRASEAASADMDEFEGGEEAILTSEQRLVHDSVLELDDEHRAVVVLHYFEEIPLEEIARVLRLPIGTVKSRLHNARRKLGTSLRAQGVDL